MPVKYKLSSGRRVRTNSTIHTTLDAAGGWLVQSLSDRQSNTGYRLGTGVVGLKRGFREPGEVRAGVCAEIEWTWELPSEPLSGRRRGRIGRPLFPSRAHMRTFGKFSCPQEVVRLQTAG